MLVLSSDISKYANARQKTALFSKGVPQLSEFGAPQIDSEIGIRLQVAYLRSELGYAGAERQQIGVY